jgi:hypothetical protein
VKLLNIGGHHMRAVVIWIPECDRRQQLEAFPTVNQNTA